ncbi:MAG: DUF1638 domain-containing protein, partial [Magnetococcales bacterium]|nr:DUF1638 domain-containing protein [Magnetococcales bacterium]
MNRILCVLCCHNFLPELEAAAREEGWGDVRVLSYPVRCGRPPVSWEELLPILPEGTQGIVILGRACLGRLVELDSPGMVTMIFRQQECFHLVAGPTLVGEAMARGCYLFTPSWLSDWPQRLAAMGFQPEQSGEFLRDFSRELLLLDTGLVPDAREKLSQLGRTIGLPVRREAVGLDYTRLLVRQVVGALRWEVERRQVKQREQRLHRELA